jgi:hypothetical protein
MSLSRQVERDAAARAREWLAGPDFFEVMAGDRRERLPSVTRILRAAGLAPDYGDVPEAILERARQRGRMVHAVCEWQDGGSVGPEPSLDAALDPGDVLAINREEVAPYAVAYSRFLAESGAEAVAVEEALVHPDLRYSGRPDWVGRIRSASAERVVLAVMDRKATADIHHGSVAAQCAGYAMAYEALHGGAVDAIYSLHLRKDGTYRLRSYEMGSAREAFRAALTVYRYKHGGNR